MSQYITGNTTIYVIRHGRTESNDLDLVTGARYYHEPLIERGHSQVIDTANFIKGSVGSGICGIVHSGLARTEETARIINDVAFGNTLPMAGDHRISEKDPGDLDGSDVRLAARCEMDSIIRKRLANTGESHDALQARIAGIKATLSSYIEKDSGDLKAIARGKMEPRTQECPSNIGESHEAFRARIKEAVGSRDYFEGCTTYLFVTHGYVVKALMEETLGLSATHPAPSSVASSAKNAQLFNIQYPDCHGTFAEAALSGEVTMRPLYTPHEICLVA